MFCDFQHIDTAYFIKFSLMKYFWVCYYTWYLNSFYFNSLLLDILLIFAFLPCFWWPHQSTVTSQRSFSGESLVVLYRGGHVIYGQKGFHFYLSNLCTFSSLPPFLPVRTLSEMLKRNDESRYLYIFSNVRGKNPVSCQIWCYL